MTVKGVEWVGGFGYADRERQTPITADTHFRVGSISQTFVALALVQLYEDDAVDLMAPVKAIAPNIAIDNRPRGFWLLKTVLFACPMVLYRSRRRR